MLMHLCDAIRQNEYKGEDEILSLLHCFEGIVSYHGKQETSSILMRLFQKYMLLKILQNSWKTKEICPLQNVNVKFTTLE